MPDRDAEIRKHVDYLLCLTGAHLPFDDAIADFPPALRGVKPPGAPHTAWELLEHLRLAQEDILDFSRNSSYQERTFPDDYWPESAAPPTDEAWEESVRQFRSDAEAIRALVADPKNDLVDPFAHGQGQTLLREALLVADHNAYHLGQIVFLRRMLEAKSR